MDSSVQRPTTEGTGTSVGPSAEMIVCSRAMSWAVASTCPNGGRRSTQCPPAVSVTEYVRLEWPPAINV